MKISLAVLATAFASFPAIAMAGCVVADPTTTPLNYRTAPNGQILGNLDNGLRVRIIDNATDENGKPWVYIADTEGQPLGWVFRPFINCY